MSGIADPDPTFVVQWEDLVCVWSCAGGCRRWPDTVCCGLFVASTERKRYGWKQVRIGIEDDPDQKNES